MMEVGTHSLDYVKEICPVSRHDRDRLLSEGWKVWSYSENFLHKEWVPARIVTNSLLGNLYATKDWKDVNRDLAKGGQLVSISDLGSNNHEFKVRPMASPSHKV